MDSTPVPEWLIVLAILIIMLGAVYLLMIWSFSLGCGQTNMTINYLGQCV
jgi:hypothetical protein